MKAGEIANKVIENLGLEVSMNKTKFVDFKKDDFDFVGFSFKHWRERRNESGSYFIVEPTEKSLKDFKKKIKDATGKTLTLNQEVWMSRVNSIIRGKTNYYLYPFKAIEKNKLFGLKSHCYLNGICNKLKAIDNYIRQRLRVCMIHKHPKVRKGFLMTNKWNIEHFCKAKLIPSEWLYYSKSVGFTMEEYIDTYAKRGKKKLEKKIEKSKSEGREYYTKERLENIAKCQAIAST